VARTRRLVALARAGPRKPITSPRADRIDDAGASARFARAPNDARAPDDAPDDDAPAAAPDDTPARDAPARDAPARDAPAPDQVGVLRKVRRATRPPATRPLYLRPQIC